MEGYVIEVILLEVSDQELQLGVFLWLSQDDDASYRLRVSICCRI